MKNANILLPFYERARRHPDRLAIVEGLGASRRELSYGKLAKHVPRLAEGLRRQGLKPGDRILVFVPMSLELYEILLATFHAGLSALFLDAWSGIERLNAAVRMARPQAMFGSPKAQLLRLMSSELRQIPKHFVVGKRSFRLKRLRAEEPGESALPYAASAEQEAFATFTTGSTGAPKGAARSHAFLRAQGKALRANFGKPKGQVDLTTLPAFVLLNLGEGLTSVLPDFDPRRPAEIDPERILAQIVEEKVETSLGSPAFYEALSRSGRIPLKQIYMGGAAVSPDLAKRLLASCQGGVTVVYGSTEAEPISHCSAQELLRYRERARPGLYAGKPKGIRLGIFDEQLKELPRGQVGEIGVTGDHVQKHYLNDPESEAKNKFKRKGEIWHRTGDAGYLDAQGGLFLMGRLNQRIRRGGKQYWSQEAEAQAMTLAGIRFAAYFGISDPKLGERALLCVEGKTSAEEAARALHPLPLDELRCFDHLPRDPRHASKIDLQKLKAML